MRMGKRSKWNCRNVAIIFGLWIAFEWWRRCCHTFSFTFVRMWEIIEIDAHKQCPRYLLLKSDLVRSRLVCNSDHIFLWTLSMPELWPTNCLNNNRRNCLRRVRSHKRKMGFGENTNSRSGVVHRMPLYLSCWPMNRDPNRNESIGMECESIVCLSGIYVVMVMYCIVEFVTVTPN